MPPSEADRPIVWAFSTSRMRHMFESVAPTLTHLAEVRVFDKGFEDALETVRALRAAGETVDALVAAASNGAYLRDHADLPVVIVTASTIDALGALVRARKLSSRIGVVNFQRAVGGVDAAMSLLTFDDLVQLPYVTPEEARAHVADLAARGI